MLVHCGVNLHLSDGAFFHMSLGHLYVLFGEVSIQFPCPCFNWIVFLLLSCVRSLYTHILDINPLSHVSLANMLSHTVGSFFILMMVYFAVQKLFSLMYSHLLFFPLFLLP